MPSREGDRKGPDYAPVFAQGVLRERPVMLSQRLS